MFLFDIKEKVRWSDTSVNFDNKEVMIIEDRRNHPIKGDYYKVEGKETAIREGSLTKRKEGWKL